MTGRPHSELTASKLRSAITNGALLGDLDHRCAWARRLRDLIADITNELGGTNNISEAERVLVRRASMMTLQAELMEQNFSQNADGAASAKQIDTYQRLVNTTRRTLESLLAHGRGLERRPRDITDNADTDDISAEYFKHLEEAGP
jgi:hypothetical protein